MGLEDRVSIFFLPEKSVAKVSLEGVMAQMCGYFIARVEKQDRSMQMTDSRPGPGSKGHFSGADANAET